MPVFDYNTPQPTKPTTTNLNKAMIELRKVIEETERLQNDIGHSYQQGYVIDDLPRPDTDPNTPLLERRFDT